MPEHSVPTQIAGNRGPRGLVERRRERPLSLRLQPRDLSYHQHTPITAICAKPRLRRLNATRVGPTSPAWKTNDPGHGD